jgi:hypothetical protein
MINEYPEAAVKQPFSVYRFYKTTVTYLKNKC